MIRFRDAFTLALTKLRVRRFRTIITVTLASLLFGVISLAAFALQGSLESVTKFTSSSLAGRYLTTATYSPRVSFGDNYPASVKTRATVLYKQLIARKQAAAKDLGISYDSSSEQQPITKYGDGFELLNSSSPAAAQVLNEYIASQPSSKQKMNELLAKYHPSKTYVINRGGAYDGQLKPLVNGAEDFTKAPAYPSGGTPDINFGWSYIDEAVVKSFMLPASQLKKQRNISSIPVIAPISKVEKALGLTSLPKNASASTRLERTRYIRDHAQDATFSVCYRNSVSESQIQSALTTKQEIQQNKDNKKYQKPSLIYGLPSAASCVPAPILTDSRTVSEKQLTAKQTEFQRMFGQETEPSQQLVTFRVVGLSPDAYGADSFSGIGSLITTIAGSTLEGQWVVPRQLFDAMPNRQAFTRYTPSSPQPITSPQFDSTSVIAEFTNAQQAKNFVTKEGCGNEFCDSTTSVIYFGSNSVLINDLKKQATYILSYIAVAVGVIAVIIMMGMIGRVITDSRRETAVFRAIGAKRNDIRLIYLSYTFLLSAIIAAISLVLGLVAALVLDAQLSPGVTAQAHLTYIFADDSLKFRFVGVWWQALIAIVGLILLTGLLGVSLPLSRNVARSPIKDMRDET